MPESSQTIWKPLFWLVLASLIAVYSLYNYHSDQLQAEIGDEHQSLRALSSNLDAIKLDAIKDELQELVKKEESAILELQDKLVATTQSRAELERLLATTNDGSSISDKASGSESNAGQAGPSPEQEALQARIEQLEAELGATAAERETVAQQAVASQQAQAELAAKLDEAERSLKELNQQHAARTDEHQSTAADYDAQLSEAETALEAMRRKLQEQEEALQSARAQGKRLRENLADQVSEQVHDFYQRFAPLEAQLTDRGLLVNLSDDNMRFPSGSAVLPDTAEPTLSQIAEILVDHPELRVQIEGHTDSTGSSAINLQLSEQRAAAVRDALIERGVSAEGLSIQGQGSKQPIADNATEAGRQRNRRVELYVVREEDS